MHSIQFRVKAGQLYKIFKRPIGRGNRIQVYQVHTDTHMWMCFILMEEKGTCPLVHQHSFHLIGVNINTSTCEDPCEQNPILG